MKVTRNTRVLRSKRSKEDDAKETRRSADPEANIEAMKSLRVILDRAVINKSNIYVPPENSEDAKAESQDELSEAKYMKKSVKEETKSESNEELKESSEGTEKGEEEKKENQSNGSDLADEKSDASNNSFDDPSKNPLSINEEDSDEDFDIENCGPLVVVEEGVNEDSEEQNDPLSLPTQEEPLVPTYKAIKTKESIPISKWSSFREEHKELEASNVVDVKLSLQPSFEDGLKSIYLPSEGKPPPRPPPPLRLNEAIPDKESGKHVFKCEGCDYATNRSNNLLRHKQTMHTETMDLEECCGLLFRTRSDHHEHNSIFHQKSKFPCRYPECEEANVVFERRGLLKRHIVGVHQQQKPFACKYCRYRSSHKSNLSRHIKSKHGIDEIKPRGRKYKKDFAEWIKSLPHQVTATNFQLSNDKTMLPILLSSSARSGIEPPRQISVEKRDEGHGITSGLPLVKVKEEPVDQGESNSEPLGQLSGSTVYIKSEPDF